VIVSDKATVRFSFSTAGGDICLEVKFWGKQEDSYGFATVLRERTREQAHVAPVVGEIHVSRSGTLRLKWDNLGAPWRRERRLTYSVGLFYPGSTLLLNESRLQARSDLAGLATARGSLQGRTAKTAAFQAKCGATERELTARIADLQAELAQVQGTRAAASDLSNRLAREAKALRYSAIVMVLNLVLREGWLV
jgi:hypothetical protein